MPWKLIGGSSSVLNALSHLELTHIKILKWITALFEILARIIMLFVYDFYYV